MYMIETSIEKVSITLRDERATSHFGAVTRAFARKHR